MSGFLGQRAHVRLYKQETRKEAGVTNVNELQCYKCLGQKLSKGRSCVVKKFAVVFCICL